MCLRYDEGNQCHHRLFVNDLYDLVQIISQEFDSLPLSVQTVFWHASLHLPDTFIVHV